ncbi:MAG TPA: NADH-quinone oxidoreductase subunit NuoE [Desulfotomaculum sp.]|nr:NADH-quinone oxidoreductase subunit NuoE [Desulfotomaculum sp.]
MQRIESIVEECKGQKWALIPVVQKIQNEFGYIPPAAIPVVAKGLRLFPSQVQGVISFYAQFYTKPRGRQIIRVCRGTACHVRGAEALLELLEERLQIQEGETTPDMEYTLETVACIGVCALAPNLVLNDQVHGQMDAEKVQQLLKKGEA